MKTIDIAVVGGGPAGISAALEAAKRGAEVVLFDEHETIGGQLFKQIHKFFGSKRHFAGYRGFEIADMLLEDMHNCGVHVELSSVVYGIFPGNRLGVSKNGTNSIVCAQKIILATGASEIALPFPGWTLPGVMGAGAVQTMMNMHRVLPGKRFIMIGAGNVGLIVSYQLLQSGAEVKAVVDIKPTITGYEVHAAKLRRAGVPILLEHTVVEAIGENYVEEVVIAARNSNGGVIEATKKRIETDVVCIAVGLQPLIELALMAGCTCELKPEFGGYVPVRDSNMETTVQGIYIVGDLSGVGEASAAMEEGRLAGLAASRSLGFEVDDFDDLKESIRDNLTVLKENPDKTVTDSTPRTEEVPVQNNQAKIRIECYSNIPCNPCETACPSNAITVGDPITNVPVIDYGRCTGCGLCIAACPGLAIFSVDYSYSDDEAIVSFPYEFFPLPKPGDIVDAVDREGNPAVQATIYKVLSSKKFDRTNVISMIVPKQYAEIVRSITRGTREE